jgi:hypothetical protein
MCEVPKPYPLVRFEPTIFSLLAETMTNTPRRQGMSKQLQNLPWYSGHRISLKRRSVFVYHQGIRKSGPKILQLNLKLTLGDALHRSSLTQHNGSGRTSFPWPEFCRLFPTKAPDTDRARRGMPSASASNWRGAST